MPIVILVRKICHEISELQKANKQFAKERAENTAAIAALQKKLETIAKLIKDNEWKIHGYQELLIAAKGVPRNVALLREKIIQKMKRSQRDDITVLERNKLRAAITESKGVLQTQCAHPFILSYDAYYVSASDAERFGRHGHDGTHVCVVCGFAENSTWDYHRLDYVDKPLAVYAVLTESGNKLIMRDIRVENERAIIRDRKDVWRWPLDTFIEVFILSAGCMNARWENPAAAPAKK